LCHIPDKLTHVRETLPKEPFVAYTLYYQPDLLRAELREQLRALGPVSLDLMITCSQQGKVVRSMFQEMLFEQSVKRHGWETMLQSRLLDLAVRILRLAGRQKRPDLSAFEVGNESIERVALYVQRLNTQFFRQEGILDAARSVGLSRRQFTDLFRKVAGQPWRQYVQNLRLKHAAELLSETDNSVSAVAFESGFEDLSNFHHCFKAAHGCSPLAYREQRRVKLRGEFVSSTAQTAQTAPGFRYRGIKGWSWTVPQYLEEIPTLTALRMNFLMNCYRSVTVSTVGEPWCNEWWKPLSDERKSALTRVVEACAKAGIDFCFAMHPQLASSRQMNLENPADVDSFFQHYAWMQSLGVRWFSICLDDTRWGGAGPAACGTAHAAFVNTVFERLNNGDSGAQMIFCPACFWGDGSNPEHSAYLDAAGRRLHPNIYVFWCGDAIVTPRITRVAAESYRRTVQHRLFLWDNYPVNDGNPTLHLGPLGGRDPDLCEVIDGYLSNPMCAQNQASRIPISTCADYAYNPKGYNPSRSIGQTISRIGSNAAQQQVLKDLVEIYPGFIVAGGGTGTNPARLKFSGLLENGPSDAAQDYLRKVENVAARLMKTFPSTFADARKTVQDDVRWMKDRLTRG
jgi:AraC-like DNA-binding protein